MSSTALYRLFGGCCGDHFYTTSAVERDQAVLYSGYVYEMIAGYCYPARGGPQPAGSLPLYRLFGDPQGDHFYTINAAERDQAVQLFGYVYEWVECYVYG